MVNLELLSEEGKGVIIMLRKLIILILSLAVLLSLVGCGFKKNVEEKLSEKITEGILEKIAGEGTEVNLDDEEMSFKGEDGSEFTIGSKEWPKGKAADLIPEFKEGDISSIFNANETSIINIDHVEQEDFNKYIEQVKSVGFTEDAIEMDVGNALAYTAGSSKDKAQVSLSYAVEDKSLTISVAIQE